MEPIFRCIGQRFRPFSTSAGVSSRRCSIPLQRVMTDFGADHAFGQVPKKLQEHYGIEMPVSTIVKITEYHGEQMQQQRKTVELPQATPGCLQQIAEIDGCMLPIVTARTDAGDLRKNKKLQWSEARLALVRKQGSVTPKFAAVFGGSVDDAGSALLNCAVAAGFGTQTHVHGVGDGAPWIAEQTKAKFGTHTQKCGGKSQLSGGFLPCLRILGCCLKNLCAGQPSGLDRNPEAPFEKQRVHDCY